MGGDSGLAKIFNHAHDGNINGLAIFVNHGRVTLFRVGNDRKRGKWKLIGQNKIAYNLCCPMLLHFEKRCLIRTPRSELFSVLIMNRAQASDLGLLLCCLLNAIFGKGIYIKHYMLLYLGLRFFPYSGFSKIFSNKIQISL